MPIPTYQEMMLPLLRVLDAAGKELHQKDYSALTADALGLTEEQRQVRLPSGLQTYVFNRAGWAGWYMQQAGLVEKPKRGHLRITEEGRKLLATNPAVIDSKALSAYPSFVEKMTKAPSGGTAPGPDIIPPSALTPTDQIEQAELKLRAQLASDLLDLMSRMDPYRFEQLVIDLLFAMGYGGSRAEAAQVTQKSNDGGIDGIISEDRLGLGPATAHPRPASEVARAILPVVRPALSTGMNAHATSRSRCFSHLRVFRLGLPPASPAPLRHRAYAIIPATVESRSERGLKQRFLRRSDANQTGFTGRRDLQDCLIGKSCLILFIV